MIDGAVEDGGIAQERGVLQIEMAHLFDDVDALRSVQDFEEKARTLEPQLHERKIEIVVTAGGGLERIAGALLAFEAGSHLCKLAA